MPNPILGLVGGIAGSAISANAQKKAANRATDAQVQATELQIEEQRRQFDRVQELLSPFVEGGTDAFQGALDLAGVNGGATQAEAIAAIESNPEFLRLSENAEAGILANASATGGLRGGNTQAVLGRVRPEILSSLIREQLSRLGGFAAAGQNAAAGVGTAAQNTAQGISAALGQQGAAIAGGVLARGQAIQDFVGGVGRAFGNFAAAPPRPEGAGLFSSWGF